MILSYCFRTPKTGRDLSILINVIYMYLSIYLIVKEKTPVYRFLLTHYDLLSLLYKNKLGFMGLEFKYLKIKFIEPFIQIILFFLLALYLDKVYPQEEDTTVHPLFFLKKLFNRKCPNSNQINRENRDNMLDEDKILKIVNIEKSFGNHKVLKKLYIEFKSGEFHCLLGHNGAGKSTFLNILTGMMKPDSGALKWGNLDFRELRKTGGILDIGICPAFNILWNNLTVNDHLYIVSMIKNISNSKLKMENIKKSLSLAQYSNFKVSELSGGNKRKLMLAISLINSPDILFLDEPTSAIDPQSRHEIWDLLLKLKNQKKMITILTTHHLEEAEKLADKISILSQGNFIVSGTVNYINSQFGLGISVILRKQTNSEFSSEERSELIKKLALVVNEKFIFFDFRSLQINLPISNLNSLNSILEFI